MRIILFSILLMGLAACTGPDREITLENGMKVVVREDHRAPVVVSQVWYRVGSIDEPDGLTGLSHVLEHMMFKGTKTLAPGEFSRIIAAEGGRENAFTGRDYTAYFQTLEKSRLEVSFRLEADRMQNLVLDEQEFLKEAKVVREERRLRTEDKPESLAYEKFMSTAYTTHPYRHPIIGWMRDLEAHTVKDLADWYQKFYSPSNATLVVVGDVQPKDVFALARKYFGPLPSRPLPKRTIPDEPVQKEPRYSELHIPANVPYLIMGYPVPVMEGKQDDHEIYALTVLAGVLDGGNSGRFASELVRGKSIAAAASAGYSAISRGPGMFMFDGNPANGHTLEQLEAAMLEQIERVTQEPVGEAELARVKAQVAASDVFGRDSVFYQAMRIGTLETVGLDHRLLDDYVKNIEAVTAKEVQLVAKKYLINKRRITTVLIPTKTGSKAPAAKGVAHGRH